MSGKLPDFESIEYDSPEIAKEDARIDALEALRDQQRQQQQELHLQAVEQAVAQCVSSCLACLDLLYLPRDAKPLSDVAIAHNSWRQEAEPQPCSRDTWLRGALPEVALPARAATAGSSSQQAPRSATAKEQRPLSGLLPRRRGPGSVASSAAGDAAGSSSAQQRQQSQRPSRAPSMQSMKANDTPAPAGSRPNSHGPTTIQPAQHDSSATAATAAGTTAVDPAAQQNGSNRSSAAAAAAAPSSQEIEQQEAEDRLRQELALRRQQEMINRELKQKDEAARSALVAMQKDLKGKDYTYDSRGKVVLLSKVNPDALPAPPGPQFKLHVASPADADAAAAAGQSSPAAKRAATTNSAAAGNATSSSSSSKPGTKPGSKQGTAAAATAGTSGSEFYVQQAIQVQPPVLQSFKPAAGVTLKTGGAAKQGPRREAGAAQQQQTRTQFQQQAKALNQQAARSAVAAPTALSRSSIRSGSTAGSPVSPVPAGIAAVGGISSRKLQSTSSVAAAGSSDQLSALGSKSAARVSSASSGSSLAGPSAQAVLRAASASPAALSGAAAAAGRTSRRPDSNSVSDVNPS